VIFEKQWGKKDKSVDVDIMDDDEDDNIFAKK
jgi:hypothetical protein